MEITKYEEVKALNKLLNFVKFNCDDIESQYFAGSPIIGKIYEKVVKELAFIEKIDSMELKRRMNLDNNSFLLERISNKIKMIASWNQMRDGQKEECIQDFAFPFFMSDKSKQRLLLEGNKFHE